MCSCPPNPDGRRLILTLNVRDAPYGNVRGQVRLGDVVYRRRNAPKQIDKSARAWEVVYIERDGRLSPIGYVFVDYLDCRRGAAEASKRRADQIVAAAFEEFYSRHPNARRFQPLLIEEFARAQQAFPDLDLPQHLALALPAATARFKAGEMNNRRGAREDAEAAEEPRVSTGTGFFVSSLGHVLTNEHVAGQCKQLIVGQPGEKPVTAELINVDPGNDLALLRTQMRPASVARIKPTVRTGEQIAVYGFPFLGQLPSTGNFVLGNISATAGLRDDPRFLQTSAPVQPGNSGGPMVDRAGNVLGVVVSIWDALTVLVHTGDIPQNVNFAIKGQIAHAFLNANLISIEDAKDGPPLAPADLADKMKRFTVFIKCEK